MPCLSPNLVAASMQPNPAPAPPSHTRLILLIIVLVAVLGALDWSQGWLGLTLGAERKAGELLIEMRKRGEREREHQGGDRARSHDATMTLEDLNINKHQSSRFQQKTRGNRTPSTSPSTAGCCERTPSWPLCSWQRRALTDSIKVKQWLSSQA